MLIVAETYPLEKHLLAERHQLLSILQALPKIVISFAYN